jgi:DNA-binding transcriptional MerR regulator
MFAFYIHYSKGYNFVQDKDRKMISIQTLSRELETGVDTLRVWERRYGNPEPTRDARGHRVYSEEQRQELRLVRKLLDLGERPARIFRLAPQQRQQRLEELVAELKPDSNELRRLAIDTQPVELAGEIRLLLRHHGLAQFIHEICVPLLQLLGFAWTEGSISIAREHLISDLIEETLRHEIRRQPARGDVAHILFLNLSGERHRLGLLLAASLFQLAGCRSTLIQEDLPLDEVAPLTAELKVNAVALSFSRHYSALQAKKELVELRRRLEPQIRLIAGGDALKGKIFLPGILLCNDLNQIAAICKREFAPLDRA